MNALSEQLLLRTAHDEARAAAIADSLPAGPTRDLSRYSTDAEFLRQEIARIKACTLASDRGDQTACSVMGCDQLCHPGRPRNIYTPVGPCCCWGHAQVHLEWVDQILKLVENGAAVLGVRRT
jgi:hypothetical protein